MKKIHVTLVGRNTLMMHSPKTVNPLHPLAIQLKQYTSKRKKTEEDLQIISDLEWEAGLYYEEGIGLHIPMECIKATLESGAKFNKMGKDVNRYCLYEGGYASFDIGEKFDLEEARKQPRFRDVRPVNVMRAKVVRSRPRFNVWRCEFNMMYEEDKIDLAVIERAFENAGAYVGLCEGRNMGYGRFDTKIEEVAM